MILGKWAAVRLDQALETDETVRVVVRECATSEGRALAAVRLSHRCSGSPFALELAQGQLKISDCLHRATGEPCRPKDRILLPLTLYVVDLDGFEYDVFQGAKGEVRLPRAPLASRTGIQGFA